MKAERDPRREKALDYAGQGRNAYGENDKSSRKNIRRNKRVPHRAERHRTRQTLSAAEGIPVAGPAEEVEVRLNQRAPYAPYWGLKWPDQALGDWITGCLERRAKLGMADPTSTQSRIAKIQSTHRLRERRRRR